jgi:hypothetical protein
VSAPTSTRIIAASGLLLVMGFFMGMPFPIGLRKNRDPALVPWLWGVNGAASVLCSVLATVVAMGSGIGVAFWCGVACYCVALVDSRRPKTARLKCPPRRAEYDRCCRRARNGYRTERRTRPWALRGVLLLQNSTLSPNHTDEAHPQYIDDTPTANGPLRLHDGTASSTGSSRRFLRSLRRNGVGVRMWMIVLKLITLFGMYFGAPPHDGAGQGEEEQWVGGRYAAVATLWTAFSSVCPGSLSRPRRIQQRAAAGDRTRYFALCAPSENPKKNVYVAGVSRRAVWTKLNTGIYLAGALRVLLLATDALFGSPREESERAETLRDRRDGGAAARGAHRSDST